MTTLQERIHLAVNNILSGANACGTLGKAVENRDAAYFSQALMPVLKTYEDEADEIRRQRDSALKDAEKKRAALAFIQANVPLPPETAKMLDSV